MTDPTLSVSTDVLARLEELAKSLETLLGEELVSLLVFGSAVRGGWVEHQSDVDLVLVLRNPSRETLLSVANTLNVARNALRFETMILRADEIARAADVFPLFYADIQRCHQLLSGKDTFRDVVIPDRFRRLRVEQELREMQIRLRRTLVDTQGSPERLHGIVERKLKQLRGPLDALFALQKSPAPSDAMGDLLEHASTVFDLDTKPLLELDDDPVSSFDALNLLLSRAIDAADRLED